MIPLTIHFGDFDRTNSDDGVARLQLSATRHHEIDVDRSPTRMHLPENLVQENA